MTLLASALKPLRRLLGFGQDLIHQATKNVEPVPAYAAHLDKRTYIIWSQCWKLFGDTFTELKTPEDAAAFLMIAAVEADAKTSEYFTYDDAPPAELVHNRMDVAVPGMEIALTRLFNMEAHGVNAFNNLAQVAAYARGHLWTGGTVSKFLEVVSTLPMTEITTLREGGFKNQSLAHQATRDVVRVATGYIKKHSDSPVKGQLLQHCQRFFGACNSSESWVGVLVADAAEAFDRCAFDDDLQVLGPKIRALIGVKPEYGSFPQWQKMCPRLLSDHAMKQGPV